MSNPTEVKDTAIVRDQETYDQVVVLTNQVNLLFQHIDFLYKHFGLVDPNGAQHDPRRTETGMGAFLDTKSRYV